MGTKAKTAPLPRRTSLADALISTTQQRVLANLIESAEAVRAAVVVLPALPES